MPSGLRLSRLRLLHLFFNEGSHYEIIPLRIARTRAFHVGARASGRVVGICAGCPRAAGRARRNSERREGHQRLYGHHVHKGHHEAKDATELSVQGGALVSTGNSKNLALTAGSKFRMRRAENQFSALLAANYGRGSIKGAKVDDTVGNIQGAARYDRFLGDLTLFAGLQARRDGFQGLNLRAQFDPGVGYYFVQEKTQQFWLEAGYDLLFDARTKSAIDLAAQKAPPQILSDTQTVHSARIFAGYELALETGFKLSAGLEFLQGLNETDIRRLNGTVQASAKVAEGLSMSLAFTGRYDSKPVVAENFDTVTTASLIYSFY
jgi:putative salt-induced outer membrane protein YdiY